MPIVKLQSSDNDVFELDTAVVKCSLLISKFLQNFSDEEDVAEVIPLTILDSAILKKVIEWATYHKDEKKRMRTRGRRTDDISPWDSDFLKMDMDTLFKLMLAANYLEIEGLLNLTSKHLANMFKGKTPDEIREIINIKKPRSHRKLLFLSEGMIKSAFLKRCSKHT